MAKAENSMQNIFMGGPNILLEYILLNILHCNTIGLGNIIFKIIPVKMYHLKQISIENGPNYGMSNHLPKSTKQKPLG